MKLTKPLVLMFMLLASLSAQELKPISFDAYLDGFDYQARKAMKIKAPEMIELLKKGKIQLVDIRFKEEYEAWHLAGSVNIPLNELPKRLGELDRDRPIVTACPHNDRANLARIYLKLKGFNVRYLSDGLLKTMELLRGDSAQTFIKDMHEHK
jgi:rhodanese-related sulfurtransferase